MASSPFPRNTRDNISDDDDDIMKTIDEYEAEEEDPREKCEKALTNLNVNIATMNQQYEELNNNYKEFRLNFIATMKHQQEEVNKTLSEFTCNFNKQQEMLNEEIQRLRIEAKKMRDTFKPPSN